MAKETKQERTVRNMADSVTEHLHEFKTMANNPHIKESEIEVWCQSVLKGCLGFSALNGYTIRAQENKGKMRPDLIILKDEKPICVVEVKRLGFNLDKSDFRSGKVQLSQYLQNIGNVRWGILCNGYEWRLYDFADTTVSGVDVINIDLRNDNDEIDLTKRAIEDMCWDLVDLHESSYITNLWSEYSKEATAFSAESLARALLSSDVLKVVSRIIKGEHEYKANSEVLADKIFDLLNKGLDDSISDWNEVKMAELSKYCKSQKRHLRRKKINKVTNIIPDLINTPAVVIADPSDDTGNKNAA